MPVLAATAVAADIQPELLMIPAAISASCAFMLPVATAPNAVIYGSGKISVKTHGRRRFRPQPDRRSRDHPGHPAEILNFSKPPKTPNTPKKLLEVSVCSVFSVVPVFLLRFGFGRSSR